VTNDNGVITLMPHLCREHNYLQTPASNAVSAAQRGGVRRESEVLMADDARALRNLREDITAAHRKLNQARRDGNCEAIQVCARRLDELLDRLCAQRQESA
jgi:hypothetical protein